MTDYIFFAVLWGWVGMAIIRPHWKSMVQKMKAQNISAYHLHLKPHNSDIDFFIIRFVCVCFIILWPVFIIIFGITVYRKWRERES